MEYWTAIWQSIILGTVQGLTEFLPVSSSGHLSLLHRIFHADFGGNELFVDIMLHMGTLIAVFVVMRKRILSLFKKPYKTLLMLVVATIPAVIVGYFCGNKIDDLFNGEGGVLYLGLCFAVMAVLLIICEVISRRNQKGNPLGWRSAVSMGLMQALALFPGISRSGSTITAGVFTGVKRDDVANFSFLMSIPVILGSALLSGIDLARAPASVSAVGLSGFIGLSFGIICAAVSGLFAIRFMLKVIAKANYKWFSVYLAVLSALCISLFCAGVLV